MSRRVDVLDRLAPLFEAPSGALEALHEAHIRHERQRRLRAGVLALVITALIVSLGIGLNGTRMPADDSDRSTASLNGLIVTYPSGWSLAAYSSRSGDPDRPLRNLSVSLGAAAQPDPRDPCSETSSEDAVLVLSREMAPFPAEPTKAGVPPWPVDLESAPDPDCSAERFVASWSSRHGTYHAVALVGSAVRREDRERLLETFDALMPASNVDSPAGEGSVLDTGSIEDERWTLQAGAQSDLGPGMGPTIRFRSDAGADELPFFDIELPGKVALSYWVTLAGQHGFVLGYVDDEVAEVDLSIDGISQPIELLDVPFELEHPLRAFLLPVDGAPIGTLTAFDADGSRILTVGLAPGTRCGPIRTEPGGLDVSQTCRDVSDLETVFHGRNWFEEVDREIEWRIVFDGNDLVMVDEQGAVLGRLRESTGPLAVASPDLEMAYGGPFVFGIASGRVTNVALAGDRGPGPRPQRTRVLPDGRIAFVADFVPSYDRPDQIVASDRGCDAVIALDIRTFEPVSPLARLCGLQPAQGGGA